MTVLRTLAVNIAMNHATFRRDVDKVDRRLKTFSRNTQRYGRAIGSNLGGIGAAFAGIAGLRVFKEHTDEMVNLRNKMGATYDSTQEVASGMMDIKRIARESRAEIGAVGTLYQRMAVSMKHLNVTQDQVATATQVVTNSFLLSGTTSQEAANSARQFAQGLASGSLKGDEFRSVSENNVVLTQMLAEGLNMSVGALKGFAAAGGLTAEVILPILEKNLEKTNKQVSEMSLTMGQGATLISNKFSIMLDNLNQRFGIVTKIGNGMQWMADNLGKIALVITAIVAPALLGAMVQGLASLYSWAFGASSAVGGLVKGMTLLLARTVMVTGAFLIAHAPLLAYVTVIGGAVIVAYKLAKALGFDLNNALAGMKTMISGAVDWVVSLNDKWMVLWRNIKAGAAQADRLRADGGDNRADQYGAASFVDDMKDSGLGKFLENFAGAEGIDGKLGVLRDVLGSLSDTVREKLLTLAPGLVEFWDILAGNSQDPDFLAQMQAPLSALWGQAEAYRQWFSQTFAQSMKAGWAAIADASKSAVGAMAEGYKTVGDVLAGLGSRMKAFAALNRALLIRQIILQQKAAIMAAWASAPFPANIPAVALVTAQTALLLSDALKSNGSQLAGTGPDVPKGQAHDGLNNVPSTGTYLLEKGERVVGSRLNKDLSTYLSQGGGGQSRAPATINFNLTGVSDPDVVVNALSKRRGELESMLRQIAADDAREYRGA